MCQNCKFESIYWIVLMKTQNFTLNHNFKLIFVIFLLKLQIQIDLMDFSCQKCIFKYIFWIFHVKLQNHINFLDFFLSKLQIQINLLDFSCQKHKFSWFHILNHKFKLIFLIYYKFWYFLLFLLSKFKFEWRIFLLKNTRFLFLTCSVFKTFSILNFDLQP